MADVVRARRRERRVPLHISVPADLREAVLARADAAELSVSREVTRLLRRALAQEAAMMTVRAA